MADLWLVLIVTSVICGCLATRFARKNNRDPRRWFALGVVCNVFALALLLALGQSRKLRQYLS